MKPSALSALLLTILLPGAVAYAQGQIYSLDSGPASSPGTGGNGAAVTSNAGDFYMYVLGYFNPDTINNVTVAAPDGTSIVFGNPNSESGCTSPSPCINFLETESGPILELYIPNSFYTKASLTPPYQLSVTETEGGVPSNTVTFQVNAPLTPPASSILPPGTVGTAYSQPFFSGGTGIGGTGPLSISLVKTSGSLPPGLSLPSAPTSGVTSYSNVITGTPTASGVYPFTARITDEWGTTLTVTELIEIFPVPSITGSNLPASVPAGTAALNVTLTGSGFVPPMTGLSASLPGTTALFVSSADLALQITPSSISSSQLQFTVPSSGLLAPSTATISVQQPSGAGSNSLVLQILAPVVTSPAANATLTRSATFTVTGANFVNNGSGSQSTILLNGSPVSTMFVNGTTLSTAAVLPLGTDTVAVVNPGGATSAAVTFRVIAGLQITTTSLPQGTYQNSYSASLSAAGGVTPYLWSAIGLPAGLTLNTQTGAITGTVGETGNFTVVATVTDSQRSTASARFALNVPQPPTNLAFSTSTLPDATQSVAYSTTFAATGGSGSGYTFQLLNSGPPGLTLSSSGTLSGTPTTAGAFTFTVSVTDGSGNALSQGFNLNVKAAPLKITTTGPFANVAVASSVNLTFAATGGYLPYTFSGSGLPPGTSIASNGTLSGTPTQPGTFNFTIMVTDRTGTTASQQYSMTVTGTGLTMSGSLGDGTVGTAYSAGLTASGGVAPYNWSATGVPPGLTFSGGSLTGTPTTAGTYTVVVTLTDSLTGKATQSFTVTISAPALTVGGTLPNGAVLTAYSATLSATGGTPPYTWTFSGLPGGLTGNANGSVSGTATTPGTYSITATVNDSAKHSASQTFSVTIATAPITISPASLPNATAGAPYSASFSATGGTAPYTWSATGLPAGLTLSTSGSLTGTVAAPTTATITVTAKDSAGTTASSTYSLTVALPATPTVNISGLPSTGSPATQSTLQIGLGSAYPVAVTVNLTLTFTPDSGADDPTVQFSTGGRTAQLTIPAGSVVTLSGVGVQTGTVAGTITITAQLLAGTQNITPNPAPKATIRINAAAPVISSVSATTSGSTITVTVIGYDTTRSITSATFVFSAAAGVNLQSNSVTVPVATLFSQWYASSASAAYGGQFLFSQTFNVQGTGSITSVSVTLTNATGTSTSASANIP